MKRFIYLALLIIAGSPAANALIIDTSAGQLGLQKTTIELTTDDIVVIRGTANAVDLGMLKTISSHVRTLDLSGLTIEAYTYPAGAIVDQQVYAAGELPDYMLAGSRIKNIEFPANVSIIGKGVFTASEVESLTFPESVTVIGDYALANCHGLKSVKIEGVPTLGTGIFKDCTSLANVKINGGLTAWPAHTFDGCVTYAEALPASVTAIGDYAYRGTALSTLNLRNVTRIGDFAFSEMPNLESVIYSSTSPISLGTGVFFKDEALEVLPVFISDIAPLTLAHTQGKSNYVVTSSSIGAGAYANNPDIDTVTLGKEVRSIGAHAFRNVGRLRMVDAIRLDSNVPEVDEEAFSGLKNASGRYDIKLNVRPGHEAPWSSHKVWSLFEIGHFDTGVNNMVSDGGHIDIQRLEGAIEVSAELPIGYVGVFSLDGVTLAESIPGETEACISGLPESGVLIVKVIAGDMTKVVKLR